MTGSDNGTTTSTRVTATGLLYTPQLVMSGSEDLGGGMKAHFNITSAINTDAATTFSLGGRGLVVGVSGGFGSLEIGKTGNNMTNLIGASSVVGDLGNIGNTQARPDNSVSYTTPAIQGLTLRVLGSVGSEKAAVTTAPTVAAGNSSNESLEISAQYSNGPALVRLAHNKIENHATAATTTASTSIFGTVTAAGAGSGFAKYDSEITETSAQVNYNLGFANVNARYIRIKTKEDGTAADNDMFGSKNFGIGVSIPLGNGLTAAIDNRKFDSKRGPSYDFSQTSATLVKDLSKRTNVYAAYADKSNKADVNSGKDESLFGVGVRHAF
jgi:predicted porin